MNARKKIIIFALLTLLIGGGVLWFILAKRTPSSTENHQQSPAGPAAISSQSQENYALIKRAAKEKKPELCDKFSGIDRDNCLMNIFKVNGSPEICEKIADAQLKKSCLDLDIFYRALNAKNLNGCLAVPNESYKNECLKVLAAEFGKIEECAGQAGEVKSLCESAVYYKIALKEKKPEACDKITDTVYQADCREVLKNLSPDSDKDGLTDDYEVQLSTNPFKADTDGDGMNDGDEMEARRNPLIKGK